jgi:two-component system, chemotaxis family, CheB/CheR fusion protein
MQAAAPRNSKGENVKIRQLENEVISVREEMRTLLEEQEAANEELQSANEEIVSSNEELQSINEELETSKEEIESTNEELMTINSELMIRNDQLAESQEFNDAVFFTIREAVLILTPELRVRSANPSFLRIFRVPQNEVEGLLLYEFNQRQWNIPALLEILQTLNSVGEPIIGKEISHDFKEAGKKHLVINARKVVQKTHRQQFILLAIEDITEHKQNQVLIADREQWFRRMTDNVPVMLWVAGPDKQTTYLNHTWLDYTGTSLDSQLGFGWLDGVYKDDMAEVLEQYDKGFQNREKFRIEYRLRNRNNEYRWVSCSGTPAFDNDGQYIGFTGSCTEIHDERIMNNQLEIRVRERTAELENANLNLAKSNRELEQFAYVASHDLQEPLRKIMTFSGRLEEDFKNSLPKTGQDLIDKILMSSTRMRSLIDDLLNFSRLAKPAGEFVPTDLNQVLQDIVQDFELRIKESNAIIRYDKLPVINAFPIQMQQLFYNLFSNALKFTRPSVSPVINIKNGSPDVEELGRQHLTEGQYIKIQFSDNGIGFNQEFADQAFEIFHRLHKDQYSGTGIGLALCRKIVEQHHGRIEVFSQENQGTTFQIYLPKKQE